MRVTIILALIIIGFADTADAAQVRVTGNTRTNERVRGDALRQLFIIAGARLHCDMAPELIEMELLPASFAPPQPPPYATTTAYEKWTVTACGQTEPFLLSFSTLPPPNPDNGVAIGVHHPFPSEADAVAASGAANTAGTTNIPLSGNTTAAQAVVAEVLTRVSGFGVERLRCSTLSGVQTEILPTTFVPRITDRGPVGSTYERWTVNFCGQSVPFLLILTVAPPPQTNTAFRIVHPFPPEER
jgi:hypothetical protein